MICKEVAKHAKDNDGLIDLEWLKEHSKTCPDCMATLEFLTDLVEDERSK